ncbi:VWA domain-containing protein [Aliidiomarina soli]|uniref:IMP dehydrogenase n=1 Tax=Aliidiomarina soli TaxID=1928574 RepID=A0A432WL64_9GAMM|nr:VWA domain-containing protein [Aliidiomarina soli]RUO34504.1 IMP dehydrogenase [Aliidiomarina soli]
MFEFALWWVWFLLPLPWIVRKVSPEQRQSQIPLSLPRAARFISPRQVQHPGRIRLWLLPGLVWLALVATLAQPQWVGEPVPMQQERREMMIALDLSGSMQADDMTLNGRQVTRLQAAHHILAEFIERRHGDRIGLIVYADNAFVYSPLTSDLTALAQLAREAQLGLAGQRTALGDAVGLAIRTLRERDSENNVILLLTDGMINSGAIDAREALTLARNGGIRVHTVGIGSDEMVVQSWSGERRINPSAELDEGFLNELASVSGGDYFRARNEAEMRRAYDIIDQLEPVLGDDQYMRPRTALAHWPLSVAFTLSLFLLLQRGLHLRQLRAQPRTRRR